MKTTESIDLQKASQLLKLLGDKTRLTMMKLLESHDCCVCEFVEIFKMSQPAISQHLRKLRDLELVKEERRGQWIFYSINKDHEDYPLISSILNYLPDQGELNIKSWKNKDYAFVVNRSSLAPEARGHKSKLKTSRRTAFVIGRKLDFVFSYNRVTDFYHYAHICHLAA